MDEFILALLYPVSRTIKLEACASLDEAIREAHAHYAVFPDGSAQVRDRQSDRLLLNHDELHATYRPCAKHGDSDLPGRDVRPRRPSAIAGKVAGWRER